MIFRFQQDYENHQLIQLNVNYRCTETIVEAAGKLISHNTLRTDKELQADKKGGKNLSIRQFKNQGEELISLTAEIRRKLKQGYEKDEIAILVRNNSQISVIMKALQNNGIGGYAKKQSKGLHKGMVFQDISAYLMAAEDYPEKELMENRGLLKIMNKPRRFLPREMVLQKGMTWERLKEQLRNCPEIMEQIENLEFGLGMIKKLPAYAAINFIRKGMKYDEYLLEYAKEHQCNKKELFRQLEEIQNNAYSVKTVWEWLERRKEEGDEPGENKGIQLMTMHGAKGLEFPVVFLPDCNQGIIPTKTSLLEGRIEEERRVFYVAMTRAEKELYIWGVKEQLGTPVEMSIFVDEILCK
ncbi:MAG: ATP-dependent helicase [Eubacterium sp.]|nr:ATP-dependent helicase [Eubacterium sp.]